MHIHNALDLEDNDLEKLLMNKFSSYFLKSYKLCAAQLLVFESLSNKKILWKNIRINHREFGMNFFSLFQPEREFKVYKSCKCSQIICSRVH